MDLGHYTPCVITLLMDSGEWKGKRPRCIFNSFASSLDEPNISEFITLTLYSNNQNLNCDKTALVLSKNRFHCVLVFFKNVLPFNSIWMLVDVHCLHDPMIVAQIIHCFLHENSARDTNSFIHTVKALHKSNACDKNYPLQRRQPMTRLKI